MGPELWQTLMGRQLIDGTMPRIAKALERVADALEEMNKRSAQDAAEMNKLNNLADQIFNTPTHD